jgi:hypothetical protein
MREVINAPCGRTAQREGGLCRGEYTHAGPAAAKASSHHGKQPEECDRAYEAGRGIVVDRYASAYVTGPTQFGDFPATPGAFQTPCALRHGGDDGVLGPGEATAPLLYRTGPGHVAYTRLVLSAGQ